MSEQKAKELLGEVEAAAAALDAAKAHRDTAIRKAVKAGVPITHIAKSANLSREWIYRLTR